MATVLDKLIGLGMDDAQIDREIINAYICAVEDIMNDGEEVRI